MAKKFGRKPTHLDAKNQPQNAAEERKGGEALAHQSSTVSMDAQAANYEKVYLNKQPRSDPNYKLR